MFSAAMYSIAIDTMLASIGDTIFKSTWRSANDGEWQCCQMLAERGWGRGESCVFALTNMEYVY
jgi:hypothetical protein